jgi:hypothetical protein
MVLLGIWLIAVGVVYFVPSLNVSIVKIIMAVIAIAAGLLIIFRKD